MFLTPGRCLGSKNPFTYRMPLVVCSTDDRKKRGSARARGGMPRVKALVPDRTLDRRGKRSRSGDRGLDRVPNAGKPSKVEVELRTARADRKSTRLNSSHANIS